MPYAEETSRNLWRLVGHGREEVTPPSLWVGVATTVAIVVGVIVGLVHLARALA